VAGERRADLNAIERQLQEQFRPESTRRRFTSTVEDTIETSEYIKNLALPIGSRGKMPLTQDKYVINENPARIEWERQVRMFLARLDKSMSHRVTAPMIYEWTTGISIAELAELEGVADADGRGGGKTGSANMHLRHINAILFDYFGKPYKTKIAGRQVGKAYKVRQYFRVADKKPMQLALWPEFERGLLQDQRGKLPNGRSA
jgi:hypothetical protein